MIAKPRRLREAPTKPPTPRHPRLRDAALRPAHGRNRRAVFAKARIAGRSRVRVGKRRARPRKALWRRRAHRSFATRASPTSVAANAQRRRGTAAERAQRGDFPRGRPAGSTPSRPRAADPSSRERRCTAPYRVGVSEERVCSVARRDHSLARPRERNPHERAVAALAKVKTALKVAHRMRTAPHAHRIVVLDAGRVVEKGGPPASSPRTAPSPASAASKA